MPRTSRRRNYRKRLKQRREWHRREICMCWCGARGTYEELWSEDDVEDGCGGTGTRQCFCGGDQCVCHNHGELECFGCEDCEPDDYDDGDDDYYDDY